MTFSRSFQLPTDQRVQEAAATCDLTDLSDEHRDLFHLGVAAAVGMVEQVDGDKYVRRSITISGWLPVGEHGTTGLTVNVSPKLR